MSEKQPAIDTPARPGKALLHALWRMYRVFALMIGTAMLVVLGINLFISLAVEPDAQRGIDQAFHIPSRHLAPTNFRRGGFRTLKVDFGSGYDEAAFVADLLQAGWQPRAEEQHPWRSFDRAGFTLRLYPTGLFALPTCLDSPEASEPTDLRTIHP